MRRPSSRTPDAGSRAGGERRSSPARPTRPEAPPLTRVILVDRIDDDAEARLERVADIVRPHAAGPAALAAAAADADAIIVRTSPVPAGVFEAARHLRVVGKHGVGVDNIDIASATDRGVLVVSTPNANAVAVSEFTLACMLILLRPILSGRDALRSGRFARDRSLVGQLAGAGLLGGELAGRRVGVVGFGTIGRRVTSVAAALGAASLVHDPYVPPEEIAATGAAPAELEELLSTSDVVTIHVPASKATAGLLSSRTLALMQPHAILINTSRGSVVDEDALVEALRAGRIRAAALDVFREEPPPPDHPLLALDNVLCTPHLAGGTVEASSRMAAEVVDAVLDVLAGRIPQGVANPEVLSRM